jgi:hypothetical protein
MIIVPHSRLPRLSRMLRHSDGPHRGADQVDRDTRVAHRRDLGVIPASQLPLRRAIRRFWTLLHERPMNAHCKVGMLSDLADTDSFRGSAALCGAKAMVLYFRRRLGREPINPPTGRLARVRYEPIATKFRNEAK